MAADGVVDALPQRIWITDDRRPKKDVCLRTSFEVEGHLRSAKLIVAAEYCHSALYVNDERVARGEPYDPLIKIC